MSRLYREAIEAYAEALLWQGELEDQIMRAKYELAGIKLKEMARDIQDNEDSLVDKAAKWEDKDDTEF